MNYTEPLKTEETLEQGINRLKETVSLRDQMGGEMYWNIMNDDCCLLGSQLVKKGANREEIHQIIGTKNAR